MNFRQSYYYWNMNDLAALPNGLDGLTSNHNWATVRKMGSVNLLVHATNNLRFSFEYYRNTRDGVTETTRSLDYFGSSATWGSFARANPYLIVAPLSEATDRVTGGIDYTNHGWALHYRLGYQSFTDSINGTNAKSPERSINIDDPTTAKELVNGISYSDFRKLSTPVSEFSYTGKDQPQIRNARRLHVLPLPRTRLARYGLRWHRRAPTAAARPSLPYAVSLSTRAQVAEPNNVIDQGFTYKITEWWSALARLPLFPLHRSIAPLIFAA